MPTDSQIKERLLESHDEFRQLAARHQELDARLIELSSKTYLSQPEQVEEVTLKKRKLQLKDRMEDILRRHRPAAAAAASAGATSATATS